MGAFVRRVRRGKIASPTTQRWSTDVWKQGFDEAAPHDDQDQLLFTAGNWFASRLASLRTLTPELGTFGLQAGDLIRSAIASVNRNWVIAQVQLRPAGKPGDVVLSAHLIAPRLKLPVLDIEVDPGAYFEAAVDCMRHIISATAPPSSERAGVEDVVDGLMRRSVVSSAYFALEELWKDCLWNGWGVFAEPDCDIVRPTDGRQALAEAAASFRQKSVGFEVVDHYLRSWKRFPKSIREENPPNMVVSEIRGSGKDREIILRRRRTDEAPLYFAWQLAGNGPWLDHLLTQELPKLPQITPELLFRVWDYLYCLAEASTNRMPADTSVSNLSKLWSYAPVFGAAHLRKSVMRALGITLSQAKSLLDVFTMTTLKDRDAWLTPLWSTGDRYYLLVPVALTANPRRLYEHWLTLGGVDLGVRGALFEQYVREQCIDAIAESRLLRHVARCAGGQIEISATVGDMDVVCLLGNTVIVAECKCTTTPATAVERSNYFAVLHDAADQVSRKIAYAITHVDELSVATGWTLNNPRFVGIVVTDQEVGVGQLITGVPVVDCLILTKYLHEGFLEHGVLFEDDGTKRVMRTIAFYESADDAEGKLMDYLLAPPQLWTALRSAKIRESPLLVAPGERPAAYRSFEVDMSTERRQRNQSSADNTTDSK